MVCGVSTNRMPSTKPDAKDGAGKVAGTVRAINLAPKTSGWMSAGFTALGACGGRSGPLFAELCSNEVCLEGVEVALVHQKRERGSAKCGL